jgi:hypothetical protein
MKGALMQLKFFGAEDINLISNDEITNFKIMYKRHTPFAIENRELLFSNKPLFGSTSIVKILPDGDMISKMYLQLDLPYDSSLNSSYWVNRVGFKLIKKIELYIGNYVIDKQYGLWMYIWSELTHSKDKKGILDKLVGPTGLNGTSNGYSVNNKRTLTIPLMFFFCKDYYSSLPLFAIKNKDIYLKFFFEKKTNCIQSGTLPSGDIKNVKLLADYIFLEKQESAEMVMNELNYSFETVQIFERNMPSTGTKTFNLPFNLPTKELFWVNKPINNTLDKFTNFTNNSKNTFNSIQFKLSGKNIFSSKSRKPVYFNNILPYSFHTGNPDIGINCYPFCLKPESFKHTGEINLREANKGPKKFSIIINSNIESFLTIFSNSYNYIKIKNGEIDLKYKF